MTTGARCYVLSMLSDSVRILLIYTLEKPCIQHVQKPWESRGKIITLKVRKRWIGPSIYTSPNHQTTDLFRWSEVTGSVKMLRTNATSMRWTKTTILNGRRPYLPKLPGRHGIQSRRCSVLVNLPPLLLRAYWSWVSLNKAKLYCKIEC